MFGFFWSFLSQSRIFHSYGGVTIAGEGLQILTYARHSWPLSSEGSLTCHTHCNTGLLFILVISKDPRHSHLLPSVWQWSCRYLFLRLRSVATGNRTPISRMRGERSTSTPPRRSPLTRTLPMGHWIYNFGRPFLGRHYFIHVNGT